uniref:Zinc finger matrin-type protein 5 n=1 Tax=Ursus maritimus TaxID=29073 RepID=A0A452UPS7_URSMA
MWRSCGTAVSGKSRLILKEGLRIPASSSRHEGAEGGGARSRRALRNQAAVAAGARAMGKHYFCDYCNRSFQDNLHNRKKHLNGLQHLKAKKVWYDMFRDAAAILLDEQNKRPCRKFLLTGQCDFGSNCRFSHMSERDLQELSIQVEEERRAREWPLDVVELPEGHLEDWLEKRAKRLSSAPSSRYKPRGSPSPVPSGRVPEPACPHRKLSSLHELPRPRGRTWGEEPQGDSWVPRPRPEAEGHLFKASGS